MTEATTSAAAGGRARLTITERIEIIKNKRFFPLIFPLAMLALLVLGFGVATGGDFFSATVFKGIFNQSIIVGAMATAVCFIYTTGNIDFSVGSVMGLACVFGAMAYQATENMAVLLAVTFLGGVLLMMVNCTLGGVFHIKSAMVAIVSQSVCSALTVVLVGANPLKVDYKACKALEAGFRPATVILYFVICLLIFHRTEIGRALRMIGGNEKCSRQCGMNINRLQYIAFLIAGVGVGLAGIYQTLRTGNVAQGVGDGMGMDVMLATVLGGMSIFGGARSNAYAGVVGAITITVLNKGLLMMGVSATLIQGVRGIMFLLLVFLNSERQATLPSRQQF